MRYRCRQIKKSDVWKRKVRHVEKKQRWRHCFTVGDATTSHIHLAYHDFCKVLNSANVNLLEELTDSFILRLLNFRVSEKTLEKDVRVRGVSEELRQVLNRVVRASDCQCQSRNSPGFDPSILRHSGI